MNFEDALPTVLLYDPAVSSLNIGDHIISDSCDRELAPILEQSFVVRISSHLPVSRYLTYIGDVEHRFVCGSNLLRGRMNSRFRQWDVTPRWARQVGPATLLGVGWWQYGDELNTYTRRLYRTVLDRDITHSVRDEFTADRLRSMGFNVLNTGCPTMWQLTEDHCAQIPSHQGARVVTTVTDYRRDPTRDRAMLMTLGDLYGQVLIWIQGSGDLPYLRSLDLPRETFNLISPTLTAYDDVLSMPGTDYVGTRLHAGIRALQHGRRSLILGVDNRAAETHRDFNVPFLAREDISSLGGVVSRPIATSVRIPEDAIRTWRRQFPQLRKTTDQS